MKDIRRIAAQLIDSTKTHVSDGVEYLYDLPFEEHGYHHGDIIAWLFVNDHAGLSDIFNSTLSRESKRLEVVTLFYKHVNKQRKPPR